MCHILADSLPGVRAGGRDGPPARLLPLPTGPGNHGTNMEQSWKTIWESSWTEMKKIMKQSQNSRETTLGQLWNNHVQIMNQYGPIMK
jgi:hypothetical protein